MSSMAVASVSALRKELKVLTSLADRRAVLLRTVSWRGGRKGLWWLAELPMERTAFLLSSPAAKLFIGIQLTCYSSC